MFCNSFCWGTYYTLHFYVIVSLFMWKISIIFSQGGKTCVWEMDRWMDWIRYYQRGAFGGGRGAFERGEGVEVCAPRLQKNGKKNNSTLKETCKIFSKWWPFITIDLLKVRQLMKIIKIEELKEFLVNSPEL